VNALIQLNHPCLLAIKGICQDDGRRQIITEFLPNGSLCQFIDDSGVKFVSHTNQMKWIVGIVLGMWHMHSQHIVHRDLKPENILLDVKFEVKICDFGCSKDATETVTLTSNFGTPLYEAPELFNGEEINDLTKVDVFSFGLVLYEIIYGKLTYKDTMAFAIQSFHNDRKRPQFRHSELDSSIEKQVQDLIKQCCDQVPGNRSISQRILKILDGMYFKLFYDLNVTMIQDFINTVFTLSDQSYEENRFSSSNCPKMSALESMGLDSFPNNVPSRAIKHKVEK